jgi:UPF0755 protein
MRSFVISVVLLALLGGAYWWYSETQYNLDIKSAVDFESSERVPIEVEKGQSIKSIAKELKENNVITSVNSFYSYVKRHNLGEQVEAGNFILRRSYTIPEIVEYLTRARSDETPLTIREGLTIAQIDDYLADQKILADGDFENCAKTCAFDFEFLKDIPKGQGLEGYLFPDTYYVDPLNISAEGIIRRMLNNFEIRTNGMFPDAKRTMHEAITMASIIEKEERANAERPKVAGVLWKRFDSNTGLGADATVRYVLNKWTEPLYQKDLDVDSPYNTRKYAGLPPGPIGNPGLKSIEAALNPTETPYWYYLHGDDGVIRYGVTLEEHLANKRQYLQ